MDLIQANSERELTRWLIEAEKDPSRWTCVDISPSRLREPGQASEAKASRKLRKIRQLGMQAAYTLVDSPAARCAAGKTFIFEDGDVLMLLQKTHPACQRLMEHIRREAASHPLEKIVEVYDVQGRLAELFCLLMAKKDAAVSASRRREATYLAESLLERVGAGGEAGGTASQRRLRRTFDCVLVIDDDALTRELIASTLKGHFHVVQAGDALSGIAAYIDHIPDIVFLDIHLPDVSGHEILKRLLALDPKADVVMLSADNIPENSPAVRLNGAAGFICKPFSKEKILEYIRKCPTVRPAGREGAALQAAGRIQEI